ncbi:hydrogenase maturation nickel metallochaperone HypA [Neomoorella thermoacetica]|uniref:hydrogenase maturation nickel metallochaperone HypA/HybF n=1 Tax=Neomoorella thermoacetica TaxID=1525 RepID=UPI0008FA2755|nr:hydrogenase maturation nickel metallochaperone HypA [Moorella thermoacetica]OIQ12656.1 hydrogenase nickel incorporation protein HypA [Moorella thermoacetica]
MHELAIMQEILEIVTRNAHSHGLHRVTKIKLVIGKLRAVEPECLEFCFNVLKEDIPLIAKAALEIEIKEIGNELYVDCIEGD